MASARRKAGHQIILPVGAFDGERLEVGADLRDLLAIEHAVPGRHLLVGPAGHDDRGELGVALRELGEIGGVLAEPRLAVRLAAVTLRAPGVVQAAPGLDRRRIARERIVGRDGGSLLLGRDGRLSRQGDGADRDRSRDHSKLHPLGRRQVTVVCSLDSALASTKEGAGQAMAHRSPAPSRPRVTAA